MSRLGTAAILLGAAVVLGFVAHGPLLVLVGQRGVRAEKEDGPRARRLLAVLGWAALATLGVGLWLSPSRARYALLVPLGLGAVLGVLVRRRLEKTLGGELLVAAALCSAGAAVGLAGGASPVAVIAALAAWFAAFTASTLAVHAVLAKSPRRRGRGSELALRRRRGALVGARDRTSLCRSSACVDVGGGAALAGLLIGVPSPRPGAPAADAGVVPRCSLVGDPRRPRALAVETKRNGAKRREP